MMIFGFVLWGVSAAIDVILSLYRMRDIKTPFNLLQFSDSLRESPKYLRVIGYTSAFIGATGFALIYAELGFKGFPFIAMIIASSVVHALVIYWVTKALHLWIKK